MAALLKEILALADIDPLAIDWGYVVRNYILSEDIMNKYFEHLSVYSIIHNQSYSEDFIDKHIYSFSIYELIFYHFLSDDFLNKHEGLLYIHWEWASNHNDMDTERWKHYEYFSLRSHVEY